MRFSLRLLFSCTGLMLVSSPRLAAAADDAAARWERFEPEFRAFAAADAAQPPLQGGILFVGSSIGLCSSISRGSSVTRGQRVEPRRS